MPLANRIVDNTFGIQQDSNTGASQQSNQGGSSERRRDPVYLDPLTGVPSDSAYVSILSQAATFGQSGVVEPIWYWLPELIALYDALIDEGGGIVPLVSSWNGRGGAVLPIRDDYQLDLLADVDPVLAPNDGDALIFDAMLGPFGQWTAGPGGGGGAVSSVFTRTGDVVAQLNDYVASLIGFTPYGSILATEVQSAIEHLEDTKLGTDTTLEPSNALAEPIVTGIISGGQLTGLSTTQFEIQAGEGFVIDSYTDYGAVQSTNVTWPTQTVNLLNPTTEFTTYVRIDDAGSVITSNTPPTPSTERTTINIGRLVHDPEGVNPPSAFNNYNKIGTIGHLLIDYLDYVGPPTTGLQLIAKPGTMQAEQTSGTIFVAGINELVDPTNPNVAITSAVDPYTWYYMKGNGDLDPAATSIDTFDNLNYDPNGAGVLVPVSNAGAGARATIQYAFALAPGVRVVLYGQSEYTDLEEALDQLAIDRSNLIVPPGLDGAFGPIFAIGMRQGATDLSLETDAFIVSFISSQNTGGNGGGSGNIVTSVFGRIGDVLAAANDYSADLIEFDPTGSSLVSTDVDGALKEIDTIIAALPIPAVLNDLGDVTIAGLTQFETLVYDGVTWANQLMDAGIVNYAGTVPETDVKAAIDNLDGRVTANEANIATLTSGKVSTDPAQGGTGANTVPNMVRISQGDYDALTPDVNTLYIIDS